MGKQQWKPGTMVYPVPAVLVTCGSLEANDHNVITIAWTGTICSDPPMCYISVRKSRHSHALLAQYGNFVINLTTKDLAYATDWCGVRSGRDCDKFKEMNLTAIPATQVSAPLISESPINIECKITEVKELGTHDMFLAEVVAVSADEAYLDKETGKFDLAAAKPVAYSHGMYYQLGDAIGKFGYSVQKKKSKRKKKGE